METVATIPVVAEISLEEQLAKLAEAKVELAKAIFDGKLDAAEGGSKLIEIGQEQAKLRKQQELELAVTKLEEVFILVLPQLRDALMGYQAATGQVLVTVQLSTGADGVVKHGIVKQIVSEAKKRGGGGGRKCYAAVRGEAERLFDNGNEARRAMIASGIALDTTSNAHDVLNAAARRGEIVYREA